MHHSPVDFPHKGQWHRTFMGFLSAPEQTVEQSNDTPVILGAHYDCILMVLRKFTWNGIGYLIITLRVLDSLDQTCLTQLKIHVVFKSRWLYSNYTGHIGYDTTSIMGLLAFCVLIWFAQLEPLLLRKIDFNHSMDKWLHPYNIRFQTSRVACSFYSDPNIIKIC